MVLLIAVEFFANDGKLRTYVGSDFLDLRTHIIINISLADCLKYQSLMLKSKDGKEHILQSLQQFSTHKMNLNLIKKHAIASYVN